MPRLAQTRQAGQRRHGDGTVFFPYVLRQRAAPAQPQFAGTFEAASVVGLTTFEEEQRRPTAAERGNDDRQQLALMDPQPGGAVEPLGKLAYPTVAVGAGLPGLPRRQRRQMATQPIDEGSGGNRQTSRRQHRAEAGLEVKYRVKGKQPKEEEPGRRREESIAAHKYTVSPTGDNCQWVAERGDQSIRH